jgi:hypothetical protein
MRIKDVLLDAAPEPAHPQFCFAVPVAIDARRAPGPLDIYGYDFDRDDMQVLLMNTFGFRDITFAVIRNAHYHWTIDLRARDVPWSPDNQAVALTLNHIIHHAIPVIQPATSLCESRIEQIPAGRTITYDPPLIDHAQKLSATQTMIVANAVLDYDSNAVNAGVCMTASGADMTGGAASGCAAEMIYTSDADREIEWISPAQAGHISYTHVGRRDDVRPGRPAGVVARWTFDGFGSSAQMPGPRVTAGFRAVRLVTTKIDKCLTPIAYSEAKRQRAISPETAARLDVLLKAVDPAILALRPRFAPAK